MARRLVFIAAALWLAALIGAAGADDPVASFEWKLPSGFPAPRVPTENPMTASKVLLGRYLFYDTRLSENGTEACATCHEQARAFTDGRTRAVGSTGEVSRRNSMSLANVAYASVLTWANPSLTRLEDQALVPMFGDHPVELGLEKTGGSTLARLRREPVYQELFRAAFATPTSDGFSIDNVTRALASFERTIISGRSPYDRYHFDRVDAAVSPSARRGETLFFSSGLSCFRCHGGFTLSGSADFEGRRAHDMGSEGAFHNTGLYNLAGALSYPPLDTGLYETTRKPGDVGKFKTPTLRNVAVTAPYMHDGSIATLDEVLDHYAAGGRTLGDGPNRGIGHDNPNKSPTVGGFTLSASQKADVIEFLKALTDQDLLTDARFSNPWTQQPKEVR